MFYRINYLTIRFFCVIIINDITHRIYQTMNREKIDEIQNKKGVVRKNEKAF